MSIETHRRAIYTEIYSKLVDVQNSYRSLSKQLSHRAYSAIPKNIDDVKQIDDLEQQIVVADKNIDRLEEVKFFCSLALLSEGSLVSETDVASTILLTEELIETAKVEIALEDPSIRLWAEDKITIFNQTRQNLLAIMTHKLKRQVSLGDIKIQ